MQQKNYLDNEILEIENFGDLSQLNHNVLIVKNHPNMGSFYGVKMLRMALDMVDLYNAKFYFDAGELNDLVLSALEEGFKNIIYSGNNFLFFKFQSLATKYKAIILSHEEFYEKFY